jgi:hypothetical protein
MRTEETIQRADLSALPAGDTKDPPTLAEAGTN